MCLLSMSYVCCLHKRHVAQHFPACCMATMCAEMAEPHGSCLCVLTGNVWPSRKKAISRAGGIAPLAAVLAGQSAEGSMHAAQTLLHMAKLPDLKVGAE